jgi:glycosyltransferase involved in cell wall biosynthesis
MKFLFIHQNFPGQFRHLAPALARAGHDVKALVLTKSSATIWQGVKLLPYQLARGNAPDAHPWTVDFESKVIRGEACFRSALALKAKGYLPDVVIAHPGWGESLFLKEVWPEARLKLYCEFFYHAHGADVGFDPEFSSQDPADACRVILKNANTLLQFQNADAGLSPTLWQASTFPEHMQKKITVIHDGIDSAALQPNPQAEFELDAGQTVTRENEVVTFVSRALEPLRGFHIFMRALPTLLKARPKALVLIVGQDKAGYGVKSGVNASWKKTFCDEVMPQLTSTERSRIHFLGHIEYGRYITLLQVSRVHVYLTSPFVLSWSLLEAMSVGCAIVASDTKPLKEVIEHNKTGRLIKFFDSIALAESVIEFLEDAGMRDLIGAAARAHVIQRYDLKSVCLPQQIAWAQK